MTMRPMLVLLAGAIVLSGCSKATKEDLWNDAVEAQKKGDYAESIQGYEKLLKEYPTSDRAPEAMYAIGTICQSHTHEPYKAIDSYRKLIAQYPSHPTAPSAAFLIGFIYNNDLKKVDSAKIAYEEFLAKFPGNPMVESAQFELKTLGKDANQILNEQASTTSKPTGKNAHR